MMAYSTEEYTEEQIEYKSALMAVYKWDRPQLFDCSDGIITELPKIDFEEVVKTKADSVFNFE